MGKRSRWTFNRWEGAVLYLIMIAFLAGCATPSAKGPPPEVSEPRTMPERTLSPRSLWREDSMGLRLFEDHRARHLGDVLTVKVVERSISHQKAETKGSKVVSAEGSITSLFRIPQSTLDRFTHKLGYKRSSVGKGETTLSNDLVTTVSVRVVEVLPNGNLRIEGKKSVRVNGDRTFLVVKGVVRPEDVDVDNTVLSTKVADAEIYYTGRGAATGFSYPSPILGFLNLIDRLWWLIPW